MFQGGGGSRKVAYSQEARGAKDDGSWEGRALERESHLTEVALRRLPSSQEGQGFPAGQGSGRSSCEGTGERSRRKGPGRRF